MTKNKEKIEETYSEDNNIIDGQLSIIDEKSETIARKDSALQRLDESFNRHIELLEFKKSNLLAYWVKDFSEYHDNESAFKNSTLKTLKTFKRGDIVKANLGFNIGNEIGGLHYCVVLNKNDNPYSGILNVIPLSSFKENKKYNFNTCVDIGDELFILLTNKFNKEENELDKNINAFYNSISENNSFDASKKREELQVFLKKLEYLQKIHDEISRMKHGSIAYVNQITTISKQRIFKTPILSGIKLSSNSLDLLDEKVKKLFTK